MDLPVLTPDAASEEFYARLARDEFQTTHCSACDFVHWPPRNRCTRCLSAELEWTDLPRRGKLLAFTTQRRAHRFARPEVIGVAQVEGTKGDPVRFMCVVEGMFEDLSIGQEVEIGTAETLDGYTVLRAEPK